MSIRSSSAYERGLAKSFTYLPGAPDQKFLVDASRCLAGLLGWGEEEVVQRVMKFHEERMDAEPDLAKYPELRGYRDAILEEHRGMREAGVSQATIALMMSLTFWRDTRLLQETGRGWRAVIVPEKCRIVYMPNSLEGALHAKNVDNPLTYWKERPPFYPGSPWPNGNAIFIDGVGSSLHLDEIPPEIFPVAVVELCRNKCSTVEEAEEFLVRYNYFWSSQNLLIHDYAGNSIVVEKTRCRIAVRRPGPSGISFVNGMGALDPGLRDFHRQQRTRHLKETGQDWDSLDGCYWKVCERKWANLERYAGELAEDQTSEKLMEIMERRDPSGPMCLTGGRCHPDEKEPACTTVMDVWFTDQKRLHRRQWRDETPVYLDTPELVAFN